MDDRAHKRVAVDREVECRIDGVPVWVRIYDLSAGGAMVELGKYDLAVGADIELNLYDMMTVSGQVAWRVGNNAGVRFSSLIADWILERMGVVPTSFTFEELPPRDRYGELLKDESQAIGDSPDQESAKPEETSVDWAETARLQEDRRAAERDETSRRREPRLEIDAKAKLNLSPHSGVEGQLANLSASGCNFVAESGTFKLGDVVWLKVEPLEPWKGVVRWVDAGRVGIEFDHPFYPAVVEHLVASSKATVWQETDKGT